MSRRRGGNIVNVVENIEETCFIEETEVYQPQLNFVPESSISTSYRDSPSPNDIEEIIEIDSDDEDVQRPIFPACLPDRPQTTFSEYYQCPHCTRDFRSELGLNRHIRITHKKSNTFLQVLPDDLGSDVVAPDPKDVRKKKLSNLFQCPYCPKNYFKLERYLKCHITAKHKSKKETQKKAGMQKDSVPIHMKHQFGISFGNPQVGGKIPPVRKQPIQFRLPQIKCKPPVVFQKSPTTHVRRSHQINYEFPDMDYPIPESLAMMPIKQESTEDIEHSETEYEDQKHGKNRRNNNIKLPPVFCCTTCRKRFRRDTDLKIHIARVHRTPRTVSCPECMKKFQNKSLFMAHMEQHINQRKTQQERTGNLLNITPNIVIKQETEEQLLETPTKSIRKLPAKKKKYRSGDYFCTVCGLHRPNMVSLKQHMLCHSEERSHACDLCPKTFKYRRGLREHWNKTHFRVLCKTCGSTFTDRASYRGHLEIYNCSEEFLDHIGPRSTATSKKANTYEVNGDNVENSHENSFDDEFIIPDESSIDAEPNEVVRFEITEIEGTSRKTGNDSENETSDEDTDDKLSCRICKTTFLHRSSLFNHKWKFHNNRICPICEISCDTYYIYQEHMKTHGKIRGSLPPPIGMNNQKNTGATNMLLDDGEGTMWKKVGRKFKCLLCGTTKDNRYLIKKHRIVHTGERNFACTLCPKTFRYVSGLDEHMANHDFSTTCEDCGKQFFDRRMYKRHMQKSHNKKV
ncbi:hypothetical protein DMENIID0001_132180 [Sergentomyia squamirostris]